MYLFRNVEILSEAENESFRFDKIWSIIKTLGLFNTFDFIKNESFKVGKLFLCEYCFFNSFLESKFFNIISVWK